VCIWALMIGNDDVATCHMAELHIAFTLILSITSHLTLSSRETYNHVTHTVNTPREQLRVKGLAQGHMD